MMQETQAKSTPSSNLCVAVESLKVIRTPESQGLSSPLQPTFAMNWLPTVRLLEVC